MTPAQQRLAARDLVAPEIDHRLVVNLERAIDLKPEDPTINDHLGDAYWRIGRTLEAKFQWAHARDLKPEPEELPKIEAKIENGLPDDTSSAASADKKKEDGKGG